jgi:hypothetical protein
MKVNIHNQCSDFKLVDQKRFSSGSVWYGSPDKEADAGSITSIGLIASMSTFKGILTYVLQREDVKSGDQPESGCIRLFIAWKYEGYRKPCVLVQLMECYETFHGRIISSEDYYKRCVNQLCTYTGPIKDTWLIYDGTVLMTELELDLMQRNDILNITISESVRDEHTKMPVWLNPEM